MTYVREATINGSEPTLAETIETAGPPGPMGEDTAERLSAEVVDLRKALASRGVIEQAKGMIAALPGCTLENAWAALVRLSQDKNIKVHTLAARIVELVETTADTPETALRGLFDQAGPSRLDENTEGDGTSSELVPVARRLVAADDALRNAEAHRDAGAGPSERMITARIELYRMLIAHGWEPPYTLLAEVSRDVDVVRASLGADGDG